VRRRCFGAAGPRIRLLLYSITCNYLLFETGYKVRLEFHTSIVRANCLSLFAMMKFLTGPEFKIGLSRALGVECDKCCVFAILLRPVCRVVSYE
jgi:hypothetical protein